MTFSTEKNKIFKLWNDSIGNQFEIDKLSSNSTIIFNKISNLNNKQTVYNNVINSSSEWLIPETQTLTNDDNFIIHMFKEYQVVFNGIDKKLIPYIDSKISYRLGDGRISSPLPKNDNGVIFDEANSFEILINSITEVAPFIEEVNGEQTESENLKKITYTTSIFLRNGSNDFWDNRFFGLPPELQLRFFVNIVNPIYYQST